MFQAASSFRSYDNASSFERLFLLCPCYHYIAWPKQSISQKHAKELAPKTCCEKETELAMPINSLSVRATGSWFQ